MAYTVRTLIIVTITTALLAYALPLVATAQDDTALRETIRASLMSDPRASGIPAAQIDAMVDILVRQAQRSGLTSRDITWRPAAASPAPSQGDVFDCGSLPKVLCDMDRAFGFIGPDSMIAFTLGAASMGLVWIFAEMLHRRRYAAAVAENATPVQTSGV